MPLSGIDRPIGLPFPGNPFGGDESASGAHQTAKVTAYTFGSDNAGLTVFGIEGDGLMTTVRA